MLWWCNIVCRCRSERIRHTLARVDLEQHSTATTTQLSVLTAQHWHTACCV
jgi:hypothetical protein